MSLLCNLIGHKLNYKFYVNKKSLIITFDSDDIECKRCHKIVEPQPISFQAEEDQLDESRLLPCPLCRSNVQIYGSDCYPESGMEIECDNEDCDYSLVLSNNRRTNNLKKALTRAHNFLAATPIGE